MERSYINFPELKDHEDILAWAINNNDKIVLATSLGRQTLIIEEKNNSC
tara:strand:- start:96 stop:242 length:147 start_codon:yes stop_codon:yes gene_type:complete